METLTISRNGQISYINSNIVLAANLINSINKTNAITTVTYKNNENFFQFDFSNYFNKKEELYITAIKNLRKKIRFDVLNKALEEGEINELEYEHEIETNEDKYVIPIQPFKNENEFFILHEIITKINEGLSYDEVSEIFSVNETDLKRHTVKFLKETDGVVSC